MGESPAPGTRPARAQQQRGKLISMPTPRVVRQRRYVRLAMLFLALLLAGAVAGRVYLSSTRPPSAEQAAGVSLEEAQVLDLVNRERAKAGLPTLKLERRLAVAARGHSYDMALRRYFSHRSADGVSAEQRLRGSDIGYAEMGENIYMDDLPDASGLAQRAVRGWMASPGHRKNMLSPE